MCINTQKPKALLVTGKRLRRRVDQDTGMLEVVTDTAKIEQVASHKILGSFIDEDLTYEVHVDELCMQQHFRATRPFSPYRVVRLRVIGSLREFLFED